MKPAAHPAVLPTWQLRSASGDHGLVLRTGADGTNEVSLLVDHEHVGLPSRDLTLRGVGIDSDAVLELGRRARFEADRLWEMRGEEGPTWTVDLTGPGMRLLVHIGSRGRAVGGPDLRVGPGQVACAIEMGAGASGPSLAPGSEDWAYGLWARDVFAVGPDGLGALADAILGAH
jgi:hypothetical protein